MLKEAREGTWAVTRQHPPFHLSRWRQRKPIETEGLSKIRASLHNTHNVKVSIGNYSHTKTQEDLKLNGKRQLIDPNTMIKDMLELFDKKI